MKRIWAILFITALIAVGATMANALSKIVTPDHSPAAGSVGNE